MYLCSKCFMLWHVAIEELIWKVKYLMSFPTIFTSPNIPCEPPVGMVTTCNHKHYHHTMHRVWHSSTEDAHTHHLGFCLEVKAAHVTHWHYCWELTTPESNVTWKCVCSIHAGTWCIQEGQEWRHAALDWPIHFYHNLIIPVLFLSYIEDHCCQCLHNRF